MLCTKLSPGFELLALQIYVKTYDAYHHANAAF